MVRQKKRKEVTLDDETIALLQIQAARDGRKLKSYMEHVLWEKARDLELDNESKAMLDKILEEQRHGDLSHKPAEKARGRTLRKR